MQSVTLPWGRTIFGISTQGFHRLLPAAEPCATGRLSRELMSTRTRYHNGYRFISWLLTIDGRQSAQSQERPYHVDRTTSRPLCEVKRRRARLVLRWGTTWEALVLFRFCLHQRSWPRLLFNSACCVVRASIKQTNHSFIFLILPYIQYSHFLYTRPVLVHTLRIICPLWPQ